MKSYSKNGAESVQILHPTQEDLADFPKFISKLYASGKYKAGVVVLRPTFEISNIESTSIDALSCETPVNQWLSEVNSGVYYVHQRAKGKMTVKEARPFLGGNCPKENLDLHPVVEKFESMLKPAPGTLLRSRKNTENKCVTSSESIYLAGIEKTLFSKETNYLNLSALDCLLSKSKIEEEIKGINTPFVYVGGKYSVFALHLEDFALFSINFLHEGSNKIWYM